MIFALYSDDTMLLEHELRDDERAPELTGV